MSFKKGDKVIFKGEITEVLFDETPLYQVVIKNPHGPPIQVNKNRLQPVTNQSLDDKVKQLEEEIERLHDEIQFRLGYDILDEIKKGRKL